MSRKSPLRLAMLLGIFGSGGCFNTYEVSPVELAKLDGLSPCSAGHLSVQTTAGQTIPVTTDSRLTLHTQVAEPVVSKFESIKVSGSTFTGLQFPVANAMLPRRPPTQGSVVLDLNTVTRAQVRNYSPGKTAALTVGIIVPLSVAAGIFGFFAIVSAALH